MRQILDGLPWSRSSAPDQRKKSGRLLKVRWVLPNQLAVGRCPRPGEEAILAQAGIYSILTLCDASEASIPPSAQTRFYVDRHPLPDSHRAVPLNPNEVMKALLILHRNLVHRRPTYVHCLAGMERSPTLCIAYLCLFKGYGLWESLNWLKQVNPRTNPTEHQLSVVQALINQQQEKPSLLSPAQTIQNTTIRHPVKN